MTEVLPPKEEQVEATLRLACGHFVSVTKPLKNIIPSQKKLRKEIPWAERQCVKNVMDIQS